jgi:GNAT superfamily N-acetyltransferase
MQARDIPTGVELGRIAGWNQLEGDWKLYLDLAPEGCFAAEYGGRVVGTVTTGIFGDGIGWIAMMLIHPSMRRRGIGTLLFRRALDRLGTGRDMVLIATADGRDLYAKHGFIPVESYIRMVRPAAGPAADMAEPAPAGQAAAGFTDPGGTAAAADRLKGGQASGEPASGVPVRASPAGTRTDLFPLTEADIPETARFDAAVTGLDRTAVIQGHRALAPEHARAARDEAGRIIGYSLGRTGAKYGYIGPVTARDPETALRLVRNFLDRSSGRAAGIDVPADSARWIAALEGLGFREIRRLQRMYRGRDIPPDRDRYFALAGAEYG